MPDLLLIFNHEITSLQEDDARKSLGVDRIMDLPQDLKTLWRQIPPELTEITGYLEPITYWLEKHGRPGDYVLIQGDFGACYIMLNFAFQKGYIPLYSTTYREATEEYGKNGSIKMTHQFKHVIFRKYER